MDNLLCKESRRTILNGALMAEFSPVEWYMLKALAENAGKVVSHVDLAFRAQGYKMSAYEAAKYTPTSICRINKRLREIGILYWITSVRSSGYVAESGLTDIE